IWAPIPAGFATAADYCEHVLERAAVVVSPGGAYGPHGEGFFRISLTTPDDRLLEAVGRLRELYHPSPCGSPPGYPPQGCQTTPLPAMDGNPATVLSRKVGHASAPT